jgi:hypothetical protein
VSRWRTATPGSSLVTGLRSVSHAAVWAVCVFAVSASEVSAVEPTATVHWMPLLSGLTA